MAGEQSLINQQIEYYRQRATEYDEWFLRIGRYDRGKEHRKKWFKEVEVVRKALESSAPSGNILELACGTGLWTTHLAQRADRLIAVDSSPESIRVNRDRVADDRVSYVEADIFSWKPPEQFDYVFFGFWLSHVPRSRFDDFWILVHDSLTINGRVFFVDSLYSQESTAVNHEPLEHSGRALRKLNDGQEFEIIKEFYVPSELERILRKMDWSGYVRATESFFLYGCLSPSDSTG